MEEHRLITLAISVTLLNFAWELCTKRRWRAATKVTSIQLMTMAVVYFYVVWPMVDAQQVSSPSFVSRCVRPFVPYHPNNS